MAQRRVLFVRLGSLGDLVLTTAALRALREKDPEAEIHYLTDSALAPLLESDPDVSRVIAVPRRELDRRPGLYWRTVRRLREGRYAASVDFQGKPKTALLTFLAGIPLRIGGTRWDTHRIRREPSRYAGAEAVAMLAPLGVKKGDGRPRLFVSEEAAQQAERLLRSRFPRWEEGSVPLLGIFPGAGWAPRAWPPERFAAVAFRAVERWDARVLLVGAAKEVERLARIRAALPADRYAVFQEPSLGLLAALVARCDLFLSNDTGPMHLAVALGVPTVALFGPGEFVRFAPQFSPHRPIREPIACSPCDQFRDHCRNNACMLLLSVERVWAELEALFTLERHPRPVQVVR
ncbi:MAG: ADP-heptose--LPS heptosyltransferase [Candidatus Poribacteria bacterium]|nr:MAG: ADP-heptose--LPS heptosyltransferase [Candidatus Poribacteria bacterium]